MGRSSTRSICPEVHHISDLFCPDLIIPLIIFIKKITLAKRYVTKFEVANLLNFETGLFT